MRRPHSSDPVLRLQNPTYTACVSGGLRGHNSSTPAAALIQRSGSKQRCSLSAGIPEPQSVVIHWDLEPRNPANSTGERFVQVWMNRYLRLDQPFRAHSLCGGLISCTATVAPVVCAVRRNLIGTQTELLAEPAQHHWIRPRFVQVHTVKTLPFPVKTPPWHSCCGLS